MAGTSILVRKLHALEAEIERWAERADRRDRETFRLYREIWNVLACGGHFEETSKCSRKAGRLAAWIERHAHVVRGGALCKAVIERREFAASVRHACAQWRVKSSEWKYLTKLAGWLGEPLAPGSRERRWPGAWLSEVEARREDVTVVVSREAIEDMLLAGLEAYLVPGGRGSPYTEVYGVCFGSVKDGPPTRVRGKGQRRSVHVHVRRAVAQLRARGRPSSVEPDERSQKAHRRMAEELFPHLGLVGDFHTHPYDTLGDLVRCKGWRYSGDDASFNEAWVDSLAGPGDRPRVALILALARAGKATTMGRRPKPNVVKSSLGECHFYLAAYSITRDSKYAEANVRLRCPTVTGLGR
ncbi:hypothetical protein ACFL09_03675 [Planctomycetota bacterium]